jgi:hypothetical protein
MSDYRPQFVFYTAPRNRWRWTLYADGMEPIATAAITTRTLDECIAHARRATGISAIADLWSAPDLTWLPHPQDLAA